MMPVYTYRKLLDEVEAVRWDGDNYSEVAAFVVDASGQSLIAGPHPDPVFDGELLLHIMTSEESTEGLSVMYVVSQGDYIFRALENQYYPCSPEIFFAIFELKENAEFFDQVRGPLDDEPKTRYVVRHFDKGSIVFPGGSPTSIFRVVDGTPCVTREMGQRIVHALNREVDRETDPAP